MTNLISVLNFISVLLELQHNIVQQSQITSARELNVCFIVYVRIASANVPVFFPF